MLVSHKYKFIFIKTRKTAGTSIEVDLSKIMGDDDIVTPIMPEVDGHQPRNYQTKGLVNKLLSRRFFNHMTATQVKALVGQDVFRSYFKFSVEREPVDKCISFYSMLKNSPDHGSDSNTLTWDGYVKAGKFPIDLEKYTDGQGNLMVDRIIQYENMGEDLKDALETIGCPAPEIKTRAKGGFREDFPVTDAQRKVIYDAFAGSTGYSNYTL